VNKKQAETEELLKIKGLKLSKEILKEHYTELVVGEKTVTGVIRK